LVGGQSGRHVVDWVHQILPQKITLVNKKMHIL
jgi:hypothetical protein